MIVFIYLKHYSEASSEDQLEQDEMISQELDDDEGNNPGQIQREMVKDEEIQAVFGRVWGQHLVTEWIKGRQGDGKEI